MTDMQGLFMDGIVYIAWGELQEDTQCKAWTNAVKTAFSYNWDTINHKVLDELIVWWDNELSNRVVAAARREESGHV